MRFMHHSKIYSLQVRAGELPSVKFFHALTKIIPWASSYFGWHYLRGEEILAPLEHVNKKMDVYKPIAPRSEGRKAVWKDKG